MTAVLKNDVIVLKHSDQGQITVESEDEDRFVTTVQQAVKACTLQQNRERVIQTFKETLLKPIHDWCREHAPQVDRAYVVPQGNHLELFTIGKSKRYDFEFGDQLADLGLRLFQDGWRVVVTQLPASEADGLGTYFNPDGAIEVYADGKSTPDQSEE